MANEFKVKNGLTVEQNASISGSLSAATIYSGSTNLYSIFLAAGTSNFNTATAVTFSGGTVSGGTIYSGTTAISNIIDRYSTRVQAGTNIQTGGTANAPTISTTSNISVSNVSFSQSVSGSTGTLLKAHYLILEDTRTVGVATLSSGSVTVNTADINSSDSLVFLTLQNLSGPPTPAALHVNNISNNTSFDIVSADPTDGSTVAWMIIKY